jgi:ferric-dicitrate binding protein FerR (iron transport regulator)
MNKNRDINLARFLAGEMNVKEEIAFRRELESNPKQLSELKNMEKTWKYFDEIPPGRNGDSGKAWNKLHRRFAEDGLLENTSELTRTRRILPALRVAASILVILAIGIPALYFGVIRNNKSESLRSSYAEKGIITVDLPDGSRVYLNEGAEIFYPPVFTREREVTLKGEAFFEVMSDPVNPFIVRSGNVVVSVLGTSFNVKQSNQSPNVEVYVKTGKVRMFMENSGQFITLEPGEVGESESQNLTRSSQKDPNYIAWKTKDFKFVEAELMEVLQELEESYHVTIHTEQVDLHHMKITTSYSQQSIDAILETIGTAFGLTVSNKEDGYYLTN